MSTDPTPVPPEVPPRDSPFKPVWGLLAIFVGLAGIMAVRTFFRADEVVPWRTDLAAANTEAQQAGKPRLLYFTATWCGPCQEMRHTTWADARVEKALRAYVPIKIDVDAHQDLARQFGIDAVPTMFVVNAAGTVERSHAGAVDPDTFITWLNGASFTGAAVR